MVLMRPARLLRQVLRQPYRTFAASSSSVYNRIPGRGDYAVHVSVTAKGEYDPGCVVHAQASSFKIDEPTLHGGAGDAPTSIEALLGSIAASIQNTIYYQGRVLKLDYQRTQIKVDTDINATTFKGRDSDSESSGCMCPFERVSVEVSVHTHESQERVQELRTRVEVTNPLICLVKMAGVSYESKWNKAMILYD